MISTAIDRCGSSDRRLSDPAQASVRDRVVTTLLRAGQDVWLVANGHLTTHSRSHVARTCVPKQGGPSRTVAACLLTVECGRSQFVITAGTLGLIRDRRVPTRKSRRSIIAQIPFMGPRCARVGT